MIRSAGSTLALAVALAIAGAACYSGSARGVSAREVAAAARDPLWRLVPDVPFVGQTSDHDCGPAALAMVLGHFGVPVSVDEVVARGQVDRGSGRDGSPGVRAGTLRDVAREKGLEAFVVAGTFADLHDQIDHGRPVLVGLAQPVTGGRAIAHYEVVVGLNRTERLIRALDPGRGMREDSYEGFAREWVATRQVTIVVFPRAPRPAPHMLVTR